MSDEVGAFLCGTIACGGPGLLLGILALRSATAAKREVGELKRAVDDVQADLARIRSGVQPEASAQRATIEAPPAPESVAPEAAAPAPRPRPRPPVGSTTPPPPRPPSDTPPPPPPPLRPPSAPVDTGKLIERGAVWFFAGIGGLLAVVAVLFGLREAVKAGWLGPAARFAMGIGVGVGAFATGEGLRSRKYTIPAEALFAVGAGASYAALFAGHSRYGLVGQAPTFAMMVAVSAVTMFVSARRGSQFGTILAAIGGYLVPILLSTGENKPVAFFSYLALLDLGILYAARSRTWPLVTALSAVVTAFLYVAWAVQWRAPDQVVIGLVAATGLAALHLGMSRKDDLNGYTGAIGGVLIWLFGAFLFCTPTDPMAADPRSGLPLPASLGLTSWYALAFALLGAVGLPLATRGRLPASLAALGALGVAILLHGLGWTGSSDPSWTAAAAGIVLVPAVAALVSRDSFVAALYPVAGVTALIAAALEPPPAPVLFALTTGLGLGAAILGWTRGPRALLPLASIAAALPLYPGLEDRLGAGEASWLLAAALLVYAVHTWPPFWRVKDKDLVGALAGVVPGFVLFWPFYQLWIAELGDDYVGVLALLLGGSTLLGAVSLIRVARARADSRELALVTGTVLLFVSIAVPLQLRNTWLTVGWAVEVVALGALSRRLSHPGLKAFGAILAAFVLVRLLANPEALHYGGDEGLIILNWTLYTWGIPLVCMLAASRLFNGPAPLISGLRIGAILLGFALLNLEIAHAFAHDDTLSFTSENLGQGMVRSIAWALYGLFLILLGVVGDRRSVRLFGLVFALLGAGKVFMVDLWSLSGFARVGSLAGVAVTLLLAAVAFQRLVLRERKE